MLVCFGFGSTRQCLGVTPKSTLRDYFLLCLRSIHDTKDQTQVGLLEGKCPTHWTNALVPTLVLTGTLISYFFSAAFISEKVHILSWMLLFLFLTLLHISLNIFMSGVLECCLAHCQLPCTLPTFRGISYGPLKLPKMNPEHRTMCKP